MAKVSDDYIIKAAKIAQAETIERWLVDHYCNGKLVVSEFDDHRYSLVWFRAIYVDSGLSDGQTRNRLIALAAKGVIQQRGKTAKDGFRFDRATCDSMAVGIREKLLEKYGDRQKANSSNYLFP
jgi:hypothetical protein